MRTSENMAHADDQFLDNIRNIVIVIYVQSTQRENSTTAEHLSYICNIGLYKDKKTLKVTTQQGTSTVALPFLQTRLRMNNRQL